MKITKVEPILCSAGRKPWVFVKVSTDEGIVGYGECSGQGLLTSGVVGCIEDFEHLLLGKDPRPVEKLYYDMDRFEQTPGSIAHKAMGGIEVALWDIKAKAVLVLRIGHDSPRCWALIESADIGIKAVTQKRSPESKDKGLLLFYQGGIKGGLIFGI